MYFPYIYKIGPRQEALSLGPQKAYYAILKPYLPDLLLTQLMKYASEAANTTNRSEYLDVRLNMLHVIPRLGMYLLTSLFTTIFKNNVLQNQHFSLKLLFFKKKEPAASRTPASIFLNNII